MTNTLMVTYGIGSAKTHFFLYVVAYSLTSVENIRRYKKKNLLPQHPHRHTSRADSAFALLSLGGELRVKEN